MTYSVKDYENYLEKLQAFSQLGWVKNHLHLLEKPNFWTILEYGEHRGTQDRSAHETRSSRMLRWLMDANETHNLGNAFAYELIRLIGGDYDYRPNKNKAIKATAEDMDIDVFYKDLSQKICLAIEVKQYAKEGKSTGFASQLDKYESLVKERIEQIGQTIQPYYIYLTPLKEEPSNPLWHPVSYEELIDVINRVYDKHLDYSKDTYVEDTKKIISDFKDDLRRSIDFLERDSSYINRELTDEEKDLTLSLAEELEQGDKAEHLDALLEANRDEHLDVETLISIIKDYIYVQNHAPNYKIQLLIRQIFNYLSDGKVLTINKIAEYKRGETRSPIKPSLIEKYGLQFESVELTGGKGQGLYLNHEAGGHSIYLSGDAHGKFPNDGIQLLDLKNKENNYLSKSIARGAFQIDDDYIEEGKISDKAGNVLDFEQLMEEQVMRVIKELNDDLMAKLQGSK